MRIKLFWILPVALLLVYAGGGCKKTPGITAPQQYTASSFSQVFEAYWSGMNTNYVFWSIDTTNWDAVYQLYQPLFAKLDISKPQDHLQAFQYFSAMAKGLVDNHYNLSFFDPLLVDSVFNPADARKKGHIAPSLPFTFFSQTITQKYFDVSYWADTLFTEVFSEKKDTLDMGLVEGIIRGHILYLHLDRFYLQHLIQDLGSGILAAGWNKFLTHLHTAGLATSLIIDLRNNSGGYLEDLNYIAGQLIASPLDFAYTREKSGNGRLDYTPWADAVVTPASGATAFSGPIVVLTDQHSVSMAETMAMALRRLPKSHVIGDTTWGANGPLDTNDSLYGGGQYSFADFGYVFTSSAEYMYKNGKIYEGKGFPPDSYVPYNQDSVNAGVDVQLDSAIHYLGY
jgi:carboxyl-terminal processing protease